MEKMWKYTLPLWVAIAVAGASCHRYSPLEYALERAGGNRVELEKVLKHYRDSGLKYEAARFLIENMPASCGNTAQALKRLAPLYGAYDSINRAYAFQTTTEWGKEIDGLYERYPYLLQLSDEVEDLSVLTSDYLIKEIDRSFRAWQENTYTSGCSFETFCEYILPYRRLNGLVADHARDSFYHRHTGKYYAGEGKHWLEETDSLLYEYKGLMHSGFWGSRIPVWDAGTFERLRHGLCIHRCWYNSLLLSSLGMPATIDFVPAWGNRNSSHTWNVLLMEGQSHAFEAFWDHDRWKYKRIYDNRATDSLWGAFRLPKVYRRTYSNHPEGPVADRKVKREDIPLLFRDVKKADVSDEYFEPQDVTVTLTEPAPEGARYAYLAVFGYKRWHPVQWGKIGSDGKATFRKMGRDMVYLPVYFKGGAVSPAAAPFKLEADGSIRPLEDDGKRGTVCLRILTGAPSHDKNVANLHRMCGSRFVALPDGQPQAELCLWDEPLKMKMNRKEVPAMPAARHIRLYLPTDTLSVGEIAFYTEKGRIPSAKVVSDVQPLSAWENAGLVTDGKEATTCRGIAPQRVVDFDLGGSFRLTAIGIYPYLNSQIEENARYAIQYWDKEWKRKEVKQGSACGWLEFEDMPLNSLMMLKNLNWQEFSVERIFMYKDESIYYE